MAQCIHCKATIEIEYPPSHQPAHEIHGCDGDFIHTHCKAAYQAGMNAFFAPDGPGSSEEALSAWLRGGEP